MDKSYCLNIEELNTFISNVLYGEEVFDGHMESIIDLSSNWLTQPIGLAYFLGRIIQRKINSKSLPDDYITQVYELKEVVFFEINDLGSDFIEYLLLHDRLMESNFSLDEMLNLLHIAYTEKDYGRIVRS